MRLFGFSSVIGRGIYWPTSRRKPVVKPEWPGTTGYCCLALAFYWLCPLTRRFEGLTNGGMNPMSRKSQILVALLATSPLALPTSAKQAMHPLKSQSPEQQKKDDAQCIAWPVQQSGFDPAKP